ncbi:U1 snRNP-specific protein C [Encephalitozoon intestinalis ATCC 50506]|uniref:U1 snRNP-specific protein C n=1 Tax=Encephalitozoon intestinalis (strain ATCC 50506) TaxID=876142 RepID=E0S9G6_ENCIT|nr:U1 snRNP-specific protein C [Encephalitozoon intestinalis ATCC 50506]ADM12351.1 U1 snRNP-specific protein C [Encephalitozoon intestinalis ATCC 50506]UTX46181.1 U1 zinc finger domain-containing protein [Encephalitozoon intestinalis]
MAKYFCEFCNKTLLNDKLKSRRIHFQGAKHRLMRKAYYMEMFEKKEVIAEMASILKDMKTENKKAESENAEKKQNTCFSFPPGDFYLDLVVPEEPLGFKLPLGFDFRDKRNFLGTITEAIRKYK